VCRDLGASKRGDIEHVHLSFHHDLHAVVVPMAVWIVALAVEFHIGFVGKLGRMEPVGGGECLSSTEHGDRWSLGGRRRGRRFHDLSFSKQTRCDTTETNLPFWPNLSQKFAKV